MANEFVEQINPTTTYHVFPSLSLWKQILARTLMQSKLSSNHTDIATMGRLILDEMAENKKKGTFIVRTRFDDQQRDWPFAKDDTLYFRIRCSDIQVSFVGATGNGIASSGDARNGPLFCKISGLYFKRTAHTGNPISQEQKSLKYRKQRRTKRSES
ncbi:unnamed protein product [Dovyalis caffra]|uniref:Uncharacterized protein n=1 Tax=Dovyalis caffra TaxID=77055 RepID=A0AAV1RXV7_9ROSI|nr:unnamed protein product [Dovyalis caffra]